MHFSRPFGVSALFVATALAQCCGADCVTYGVDYQDGGEYDIDGTSGDSFSFISQFSGKQQPKSAMSLVLTKR